jgi:endo-1,4-beta-xylanase
MYKLYIPILIIILITITLLVHSQYYNGKISDTPLKQLASEHNLQLGNFAIYNHIYEDEYKEILTNQFDFVLIDNTPNWSFTDGGLRPTKDTYNFEQMDNIVEYANLYGMQIEAHHYVWGDEKWLPDWLKDGNYSPEELKQIIKEHILTVGTHYKGEIKQWTVVNEAFTRNMHLYDLRDWWTDSIGDMSYIDDTFIWAREADPDAILILNDFGNESINDVSNQMYDYIKEAKERGVPIDGIGMQMHIDGARPPLKENVIENMNRFAEIGVDVYVTEFDVNMNDLKGMKILKDIVQANIYYDMLRACIESTTCHSFAYLGITDSETWYNYMDGVTDASPLMFDREYKPKPAYYSTYKALAKD